MNINQWKLIIAALSSALSAVAAPMIAQPGRSVVANEATSPALARKRSQRIFAQEGSRILEKYFKKPSLQEDDEQAPEGITKKIYNVSVSITNKMVHTGFGFMCKKLDGSLVFSLRGIMSTELCQSTAAFFSISYTDTPGGRVESPKNGIQKLLGVIRFGREPNTPDVVVCKNQIKHLEQNPRVLLLGQEPTLQFPKKSWVQRMRQLMRTESTASSASWSEFIACWEV